MHLAGYARHQESLKLAGFLCIDRQGFSLSRGLSKPAKPWPCLQALRPIRRICWVIYCLQNRHEHYVYSVQEEVFDYIEKSRTPCSLSSMRQRNMLGSLINNDSINRPAPWRQQLDEIFIGVAEVNA